MAAADESSLDTVAVKPLQRDAVLGFEEFYLEQAAGGIGHVEIASICKHAVNVHQNQFDPRGARSEIGCGVELHKMKIAGRRDVLEPVAGNLKRYHMLPRGARVGVAVSGGADSVCLLDVLVTMAPDEGWRLVVLHLNHGWRGEASDEDARFVERLAATYGLECVTGRAPGRAREGNLEEQGREARRRFFQEQKQTLPLDRIATGHTLDDQAETVLFRALRGAGPAGLAGILPVTEEGIVRPLLTVDRAWVGRWIERRGLKWREDATNADPRFRRNALRIVMPELARLVNPAAREALARLASVAYEEEIHWSRMTADVAARTLSEEAGGVVAEIAALQAEGPAMARRLIRHAIARLKGDLKGLDQAHVERVLAMAGHERAEGRMRLPGVWAERSCGWLRLAAEAVQPIEEMELNGARLRGWRAGDQFDGRPFRDWLRRHQVPRWRRPRWPVAAEGGDLLWACGAGLSALGRARGWTETDFVSGLRDVSI